MNKTRQFAYNNLGKDTPAKKKLIALIHKQYPDLNEEELSNVLLSIKKLVHVVKKIRTEPQAQIVYEEEEIKEKIYRTRTITTDIEEFGKVLDKGKPKPIKEALKELLSYFPEKENGKRSK